MKGGDIGHKDDANRESDTTRYGIGRPCSVKPRPPPSARPARLATGDDWL